MNAKTFALSMVLGVGTAVLSAYFVSKIQPAKTQPAK